MSELAVDPQCRPALDPDFVPAVLWNRAYERWVEVDPESTPIVIAVTRPDGAVYRHELRVLPDRSENVALNVMYVERLIKLLLWMKGGSGIVIGGHPDLARAVSSLYMPEGARSFDCDVLAKRIFLEPMTVTSCHLDFMPDEKSTAVPLGGHFEGCRIGFYLGDSNRTCVAVIDGEVVHSEEVEWNPLSTSDPRYHHRGIVDSISRAAAHLPRVDAIGGGAAGIYVDNEPRLCSLFRCVADDDFTSDIRPIFKNIRREMGDVPFVVVNEGEVAALAAAHDFSTAGMLGFDMDSSLAVGYCDGRGKITGQLNELAFVPFDYRDSAPVDEYSGDIGCGVQYLSEHAISRLAPAAHLEYSDQMPPAERLQEIQDLVERGDERAGRIFESIGVYLGYSVAWFERWYEFGSLLVLGGVTSGAGGQIMIDNALDVVSAEFPEIAGALQIRKAGDTLERLGRAIAAARLPPG